MTSGFTELRTCRLLLRPLTAADRETVVEIQTDPRANVHNVEPPGRAETEEKFESWLADWAELGICYVAVIELETGWFAGVGGLQLREFGAEKVLNLYYRFRPEAWGQGYATEMSRAVIAWADEHLPQYPVQISVYLRNEPSLRVARRLGFSTYSESFYAGMLTRHFRRD
ncbi:GNAT family N-acetyltransferase [Amycolatopsis acidicola]|uniref:GNAT family N-acetyltransferase n=1 Tax=Amycolatopsis acidicola TaxID=2596893 RepID=A0A5N0VAG8_9PSEU|nr:GNAT family N-acetyltransferase [Amycolatopsis acidicola]KAA9162100.1 GNAT family N-acetyltransferase [Amycolatopsis acidicola]